MRRTWGVILFILNLCLWPQPSFAQGPHEFIATALTAPRLQAHRQMREAINSSAGDLPYLEQIELRAGIDAVTDSAEQTYKLRFYPRAWGQTKSNRALVDSIGQTNDVEETVYLNAALKERYQLVLQYIETKTVLDKSKTLESVYGDRVDVLRRKSAVGVAGDPTDLVAAEDKRTLLLLDGMALNDRLADLTDQIKRLGGAEGDFDFGKEAIIRLETIFPIIEKLPPTPEESSILLELLQHKVTRAECEWALEKAKSHDYFSYFEVGHSIDEEEDGEEKAWGDTTSVEIGIRLPLGRRNSEKIRDRHYDLSQEKFNHEQEKAATLNQYARLLRGTKNLMAQYRLLENNARKDAADLLKARSAMKGEDPLIILALKKSLVETELHAIRIEFLIRSNFIQLMELNGRLTRKPLIDYLSNRLDALR